MGRRRDRSGQPHRNLIRAVVAVTLVSGLPLTGSSSLAAPTIIKEPVSFEVTNPGDPLHGPYTIKGFLIRPEGCTSSVLLALHGLSYGQWAWDFPLRPETYSFARALAQRGHAMIAIDELGYGESGGEGSPDRPNGYTLTVEAYAEMTAQIIKQIRSGSYAGPAFGRVGLIGHSAGAEIAELTTGLHPKLVDALIATAYSHVPFVSAEWLVREWSQDNIRAAQSDYEYFETNRRVRARDMYYLPNADRDVVALDNDMANLTPSGEVFSIGLQPSRLVIPTITKPVLLVLAEHDVLFPGAYAAGELSHFVAARDKTARVIRSAGHVFMLHRNAAVAQDVIADWLDARPRVLPRC